MFWCGFFSLCYAHTSKIQFDYRECVYAGFVSELVSECFAGVERPQSALAPCVSVSDHEQ